MPEIDDTELGLFRKWKGQHAWPEYTLAKQKDLREFRTKFGCETRSNFHCPWCFNGSLYDCVDSTAPGVLDLSIPEGYELYICRDCHLRFLIQCCDSDILSQEIAKKKAERKEKREATRREKKTGKTFAILTTEALETGLITCLDCGQKFSVESEFCSCGWSNPLLEPEEESDED